MIESAIHSTNGQATNVQSTKFWPTEFWHRLDDGRVQCDVCPRKCALHEGQRGLCFVRGCEGGAIVLYTYGRSSGFCIDPIEKKPLNHFLPGTPVLSFGTAGCNLTCRFLPELGYEQVPRDGHAGGSGVAGGHRRRRGPARLPQRCLYLQRSGDLSGVRLRHGRGLPGARYPQRCGHRWLHLGGRARALLFADGCGQRRPEGLHRRRSTSANAVPAWRRCWRRWSICAPRPRSGWS